MVRWFRRRFPLHLLVLALAAYFTYSLSESLQTAALIFFVGYAVWLRGELNQLNKWVDSVNLHGMAAPKMYGVLGNIYRGVYRMQRKQSQSTRRLTSIVERIQQSTAALNDGIIMTDAHGNIEWWNRAAAEIFHLKTNEHQGSYLPRIVNDPKFIARFETGNGVEAIKIDNPLDREQHLKIAITVYGQGSRLLVIRDITRLNQLEIMRKDFVGNVSHELRTPLTVILGYLEPLLDNDQLPPRLHRALSQMQEQALRMSRLTEDLLLLSKLEATEPEHAVQLVWLKPMLETIVKDARALSNHQHQISLSCSDTARLLGDSHELRSAFSNLVFNAVRYTPEGGNISVTWKRTVNGGQLTVKDDGVGIAAKHIPRLTERFYRVDKSRSKATGGTGLGLAIVKHALLRHDGRLMIKSELGHGSRFTCYFPPSRLR